MPAPPAWAQARARGVGGGGALAGLPSASPPAVGSIMATMAPVLSSSPTFTRSSRTMPSKGAGTSIVALSDSRVTRPWSFFTVSPGCTSSSITGTSLWSPISGTRASFSSAMGSTRAYFRKAAIVASPVGGAKGVRFPGTDRSLAHGVLRSGCGLIPGFRWTPVAGAPGLAGSRCGVGAAGENLDVGGVPGPRPLRGAASVEAVWGPSSGTPWIRPCRLFGDIRVAETRPTTPHTTSSNHCLRGGRGQRGRKERAAGCPAALPERRVAG